MHSTTMRPYNEISENKNHFPETYGGDTFFCVWDWGVLHL